MAGINVGMGFKRTGAFPIDETLNLTKAQMVAVADNQMPDKYFCICLDDGKLYLYDKNETPNAETGKFTLQQSGGTYDDTALVARVTAAENTLADTYTKSETDAKIDEKLADYDRLDYKVADSPPTATKVVIDGVEVDVVEGTRYLVQITGETAFEEYVVLNGVVYDLGRAAGGSAALETALTVSNPIGKYAMNEEIPAATSIEAVLRGILSKTYYPTLTPPSASITFTAPTLAKVGEQVSGGAATVNYNAGSISPQYTAESANRAGAATGYTLTMTGADAAYTDSNATGSFTVPAFTKSAKGMVTLTATVAHEAGVQPKDSDGANYDSPFAAGNVTATKNVEFILPVVRGVSATATLADFTGMTEELKKKQGEFSYTFSPNNEHVVFAYDASFGDLTSILDQNGFENIGGFTKSSLTVNGQQYSAYVMDNKTTDTGARYTFKF